MRRYTHTHTRPCEKGYMETHICIYIYRVVVGILHDNAPFLLLIEFREAWKILNRIDFLFGACVCGFLMCLLVHGGGGGDILTHC